jgi:hypothetical protein
VEAIQPWAAPATPAGYFGKVLDLGRDFARGVRDALWLATLNAEERELYELFERTAAEMAALLFDASDSADMTRRLDRALMNPDVFQLAYRAMRASTFAEVLDAVPEPAEELVAVIGKHPAARLQNGARLWQVGAAEYLRFMTNLAEDQRTLIIESVSGALEHDAIALLYEAGMPLALREAMLEAMRGLPATLAIAHAVSKRQRIPPARSLELASIVENGQRAYVRYVACLPGAFIADAHLPPSERIDIAELNHDFYESARKTEEWASRAEASGAAAYEVGDVK